MNERIKQALRGAMQTARIATLIALCFIAFLSLMAEPTSADHYVALLIITKVIFFIATAVIIVLCNHWFATPDDDNHDNHDNH